jgi:UDP-N-acetylmuramoyl-tripeptide--D-alanyl-D-alanine ligase
MKKAWTAIELANAVGGTLLRDNGIKIEGFAIDNRRVSLNNIFVAIKGENHDGHAFAAKAVEAGACALLVSCELDALKGLEDAAISVIKVEDTIVALQKAATYYRSTLNKTRFIAVTGSNGKTTTRAMIHHILSQKFKCCVTSGNLNNHIGMPLTILEVENDSDYAIIEMGMNHTGEIAELCRICAPDAAVINSLGPAHIGILGNMENIARAKAEILAGLEKGSLGIFPKDTEFTEIFEEAGCESRLRTFGESEDSDFCLADICTMEARVEFTFEEVITQRQGRVVLPVQGRHNAYNAAAALAVCCSLEGQFFHEFVDALGTYRAVEARMELVKKGDVSVVLDCYNANPASMAAALDYMAASQVGRRLAVLGDMRELGALSEFYHRQLGRQVAAAGLDLVLCLGAEMGYAVDEAVAQGLGAEKIIKLSSEAETADLLKEELHGEAIVLFKASRGMRLERVVQRVWPDIEKSL